ncbi:unnamed protein product [Amoebophrya sp. A25]|nr:unnamed protein product [Amoebophrya sp. A25]|eukprot:GSA25T00022053001.1
MGRSKKGKSDRSCASRTAGKATSCTAAVAGAVKFGATGENPSSATVGPCAGAACFQPMEGNAQESDDEEVRKLKATIEVLSSTRTFGVEDPAVRKMIQDEVKAQYDTQTQGPTRMLDADFVAKVDVEKKAAQAASEAAMRDMIRDLGEKYAAQTEDLKKQHATQIGELKEQHASDIEALKKQAADFKLEITAHEAARTAEVDAKMGAQARELKDLADQFTAFKTKMENEEGARSASDAKTDKEIQVALGQMRMDLETALEDLEEKSPDFSSKEPEAPLWKKLLHSFGFAGPTPSSNDLVHEVGELIKTARSLAFKQMVIWALQDHQTFPLNDFLEKVHELAAAVGINISSDRGRENQEMRQEGAHQEKNTMHGDESCMADHRTQSLWLRTLEEPSTKLNTRETAQGIWRGRWQVCPYYN